MAFERKDLVQDISTTAGTAAFTPAGTPPIGMQPFTVHTVGATFRYRGFAGAQWEIGTGTWNGSTIARTVRKSSNADALVNFTAAPTVMEVVDSADVAAFLTAADGVSLADYLAANPGSTPGGSDQVLFVQGPNVVGEPLNAVATAVNKLWPQVVDEIVNVTSTASLTLDKTAHNRRRLVCTAAATLAAPAAYASVGDGFSCKVTNISGSAVTLANSITGLPTGITAIPTGGSADVFAVGGSVYAELRNAGTTSGTATVPGQVAGLSAGTPTDTTQPLTWAAPTTGTAPFTYKVEKSPAGANTWTVAAAGVSGTSYTVTGQNALTSYDYRVSAFNSAGTGPVSATVTKSTAAAAGGGGGAAAPFTATARPTFPLVYGTFQGDSVSYLWCDITATGAATVATVQGALSTSNTVAPTPAIGGGTSPRGHWFGTLTGTTAPYMGGGSLIDFGVSPATDFYYWLIITDSNGAKWNFCHNAPISFGDSVTVSRTSATTPFTQVP